MNDLNDFERKRILGNCTISEKKSQKYKFTTFLCSFSVCVASEPKMNEFVKFYFIHKIDQANNESK